MNERTQEEIRISAAGENFLNRTPISKEKRLILTTKCAYNGIISGSQDGEVGHLFQKGSLKVPFLDVPR